MNWRSIEQLIKQDVHLVYLLFYDKWQHQLLANSLEKFDVREFGYIVIDESHHAAADTYRKVIGYFRPKFTLGLTATPERHDGQSLIELFQNCAHRLELEDAIGQGLLVPIRCIRVKTNIDLNRIRYNGVDYRSRDLEELLVIPDRDRLIVDTYLNHAMGKRAVCFCINVAHSESMASAFAQAGIKAAFVSGRMGEKQRQQILDAYRAGEIQVLCACDLLNEGWDSPETEVLLMARPTLSKVVYIQQLGRGTRKASGKQYLLVFDFIDNTSRYAQAMNAHRLFKKPNYRPGAFVAAPGDLEAEEEAKFKAGEKPEAIIALHLWAEKYEPIDIFRWQDEVQDMYQSSELETELGTGESVVRRWVEAGKLIPDHSVPIGNRTYYYFRKERLDEIREQFKIEPITKANIRAKFFDFVQQMDMRYSYKPVLLLGLLELADDKGCVHVPDLVQFFKHFYTQRLEKGLVMEQASSRIASITELTDSDIERILLAMPFEKFERRKFFKRRRELTQLQCDRTLWHSLSETDKEALKHIAETALQAYYDRITP
jgi:superfamily II DNA or RNA helicase